VAEPSGREVVWITGAGRGIGRALAWLLAERGRQVAATARTEADLRALADKSRALSGRIWPFACDVTDRAAVQATVQRIEQELGPIGLAILNAGTFLPVDGRALDVALFRSQFEVNVFGIVYGLEALVPRMAARGGGQIALMGSIAGWCGLPTASAYGASKAAVRNLAEALRVELEPLAIDLRLISPGFVATPLTAQNRFPMPFLIPASEAAKRILAGLAGRRFEIAFPTRFALCMRLFAHLPRPLFFALTRRLRPREVRR
jgi:NAD(P)-dependent dehydrogenase (short-subunit alcohol dehydrogenase family)